MSFCRRLGIGSSSPSIVIVVATSTALGKAGVRTPDSQSEATAGPLAPAAKGMVADGPISSSTDRQLAAEIAIPAAAPNRSDQDLHDELRSSVSVVRDPRRQFRHVAVACVVPDGALLHVGVSRRKDWAVTSGQPIAQLNKVTATE